ncbi:MAG: DUF2586 domain-containing protein [Desulfovibrio sp.]|nr:DUF2586 domain-containing protein [Desulfovibrio sp.]
MGDVLTYLIDGTSGLAPGGVDGKAIIAGVCSRGQVGKAYLIGKRTNLKETLGVGPLVDRLRHMIATAGQEPVIVAVPVAGRQSSYISEPKIAGSKISPKVSGVAAKNADIVVRAATGGAIGSATLGISTDGGKTFKSPETSSEQVVIGSGSDATGATLVFPADASLEAGATFSFATRTAIGPVNVIGDQASPKISVGSSGVLAGGELVIQIVKGGDLNEGTYQLSIDGGDSFERVRTIPVDGTAKVDDLGVTVTFPKGNYIAGTTYVCDILAPTSSIADVMDALESPLATHDVEFVHIAAPTDSVDWAAAQTRAEELWNIHRPTYFKLETRLPYAGEDLDDFADWLLREKQDFAGRFVTVCPQFGEVADSTGRSHLVNAASLQAGRVMSIPVQRATGRVRDGSISQLTLPEKWDAIQATLEDAGYITAKKYAGLDGVYWGDSRTMADATSDFRYEEVLRTVFKAVRLLRIAALKSLYDETGDPVRAANGLGLTYLKANLGNALDTMVKANPKELAAYVIDIAPGQDIANNGVAVDITLIGIGIIRQIKLYPRYVYAGSSFDPRLEDE